MFGGVPAHRSPPILRAVGLVRGESWYAAW